MLTTLHKAVTVVFLLVCMGAWLFYSGYFNQQTQCHINGLSINEQLIGMSRNQLIKLMGQPTQSAINIKGFDEYSYTFNQKTFAVVIHYKLQQNTSFISSVKCIKAKLKLATSKYVIWH